MSRGASETSQTLALKDMLCTRCQGDRGHCQSYGRAFSSTESWAQHVLSITAFVEALMICELDRKVQSAPAHERFQSIEVAHQVGHCLEYPPIAMSATELR